MSNDVKEYDIEVYPNFFMCGIKDFRTKEVFSYEVSEDADNRHDIYNWFSNYQGYLISFNGIHYDNVVISYILKEYRKLRGLSVEDFCAAVKAFSNKAIHAEDYYDEIKWYKWYKKPWTDIDLFCYWAMKTRRDKRISLKSLGIQMGYPVVQELPFAHDTMLKREDLPILRTYNLQHDLGILDMLAEEQREQIKLRLAIRDEYNLSCMSWDAIKIASEALLQDYCKETGKDAREVRKWKFEKGYIKGSDILADFNPNFQIPALQQVYQGMLNAVNDFTFETSVIHNNTAIILSYGKGGLHSVNKDERYETNEQYQVVTSDFASLYPNLIINYRTIRFPEVLKRYTGIKVERLVVKKEGRKQKDTFLKLILNGTSGLLDQEVSWLYYPEGALKLRFIGQLVLTKVIEVCILRGWQVVSANTDGIEVIIPKVAISKDEKGNLCGEYVDALKEVEKMFNLELEHELYKKVVYKHVNGYVAITEGNKVKRKGFFKLAFDEKGNREIPLGDSCNELVIAKALNEYYVNGIDPVDVITNPEKYNIHIYDYCRSDKVDKSWQVYHDGKPQQNLNRYYFSKPAPYLLKVRKQARIDKKTGQQKPNNFQHMNVDDPVLLFNEYIDKPFPEYKINYSHYVKKIKEVIYELEYDKHQGSIF